MNPVFEIDNRLRKKGLWITVGVLLLSVIFYMSLTSTPHVPMPGNWDKVYHGLSYLVLMSWWLQLFPNKAMRVLLMILFIGMGAGLEVLQSFHPLRYFDVGDMVANAAGVMAAWGLGWTVFDQWLLWFENKFLN